MTNEQFNANHPESKAVYEQYLIILENIKP